MDVTSQDFIFVPETIQTYVIEEVAKGFKLAQYCDKVALNRKDEIYRYFVKDSTAEEELESGRQKGPLPVAPGSELPISRITDLQSKTAELVKLGDKAIIDYNLLDTRPEQVWEQISEKAYALGRNIEQQVFSVFLQGKAKSADITTPWNVSDRINEDIRRRETVYRDYSLPYELDTMLYNLNDLEQLCNYKAAINNTGTYSTKGFSDGSVNHADGGKFMPRGLSFGLDSTTPPAKIAYAFEPLSGNIPQILDGMKKDYAPLINIKIKEVKDEDPAKAILFMSAIFTVILDRPKALQVQKGLFDPKIPDPSFSTVKKGKAAA